MFSADALINFKACDKAKQLKYFLTDLVIMYSCHAITIETIASTVVKFH